MRIDDVRRVRLGTFVRPPAETGTGSDRVEVVNGYLVRHPRGLLLLDTGIGRADAETEEWYRPRRVDLAAALAGLGVALDEVDLLVNCHLHFDHCGGNARFPDRPAIVQRRELAAAREPDYTVPALVDFPGARYEEVDGEAEPWPGVWVVPTPGHTAGHQSVVVRCEDGTVVLAGQAHDHASDLTADLLAREHRAAGAAAPASTPAWLDRLLAFDPRRIVLAHDDAVWEAG